MYNIQQIDWYLQAGLAYNNVLEQLLLLTRNIKQNTHDFYKVGDLIQMKYSHYCNYNNK